VDLEAAAQDAIDQTGTAARASGVVVEADLSAAPTLGDRVLVERLVANLVDNAVRYNTTGGSVHVETRTDHGQSYLSITNTGPHIPESKVASLFEAFTRLDQRVANGQGVGLGLSIVASVVAAHNGHLQAHALPNGGLTITVRLPTATSPPYPQPEPPGKTPKNLRNPMPNLVLRPSGPTPSALPSARKDEPAG
jgi:signal transduction histidine kinase